VRVADGVWLGVSVGEDVDETVDEAVGVSAGGAQIWSNAMSGGESPSPQAQPSRSAGPTILPLIPI
jgi:hypothetical protein